MCGALQLLFFLGYAWVAAIVGARAYEWISAAKGGYEEIYLRSVAFGGAGFIVLCTVPILAKWVLIGRWKPQQIRIWSLGYVRFWIVKTLVRSSPLAFLTVGSPMYVWYLRALGAKVGRGTVIFSRHVPVCIDLLTIGANTVIGKESYFGCYRAHAGWIKTGTINDRPERVHRREDRAGHQHLDGRMVPQLGHASALFSGQKIPVAQRHILPVRPRRPGPGHRQVRLQRDNPLRKTARHRRLLPRATPVRMSRPPGAGGAKISVSVGEPSP